jgi:DNA polymerase-1
LAVGTAELKAFVDECISEADPIGIEAFVSVTKPPVATSPAAATAAETDTDNDSVAGTDAAAVAEQQEQPLVVVAGSDSAADCGDTHNPQLVGLAFARTGRRGVYVPFGHTPGNGGAGRFVQVTRAEALAEFARLAASPKVVKVAHNLKTLIKYLENAGAADTSPVDTSALSGNATSPAAATETSSALLPKLPKLEAFEDAMVMSYVLDCGRYVHHSLPACVENVLGDPMLEVKRVVGVGLKSRPWHEVDPRDAVDYAAQRADMSLRLYQALLPRLEAEGMSNFYRTIERPVVDTLARMELNGVRVDVAELATFAASLTSRMAAIETEIHKLAGHEFLIHSPKQLGAVLFDELKLSHPSVKVSRSAKTGLWSTGSDVLTALGAHFRLPQAVLEYRGASKLLSTYARGLSEQVNPATQRIHTVYQNALTTTGRLSSVSPNLQNIPNRTEEGRLIRRAFVADPGCSLVSADWSQVELRILAHVAAIPALRTAFLEGADVHARTAEEIFGSGDKENRQRAKAINFGIIYGMSEFGLSTQLAVPRAVAREYIEKYFARFPEIQTYMDRTKELCRRDGYVYTLFGRKCWIPDISSRVAGKRGFAERAAINTPIQGTSADITKLAMNRLHELLPARGFRTRMILQVHDELVFECPDDEREEATALIRATMEHAVADRGIDFAVPLPVDVKFSRNWAGFD